MYRGSFNDLIKTLAENNDFQFIVANPKFEKRMLYAELVLNFFAFYDQNYATHYKSNLKQFLNNEMKLKINIENKESEELTKKFKTSVELVKTIFDKNAFRIYTINETTKEGNYSSIFNLGLFSILMHGFTHYKKNQVMPYCDLIREALFTLLVHDKTFLDSLTGSGTTSKTKMIYKFDTWIRTLRDIIGLPKNEPRLFSYELKKNLFNQNQTCKICKQQILNINDSEIDHITCFWKGGKTIPENAQLVHRICNRIKGGNN